VLVANRCMARAMTPVHLVWWLAGTEPGAIFAVKILVEKDRVGPVPVLLELRDATRVSAIDALVIRALLSKPTPGRLRRHELALA
jgi:hypothetical protein